MEKLNELVDLVKRARHAEYTADVVEAESEIIAQDWYENILAIAEAFRGLEQAKVSAEHERDCHMDIADYFKERWVTQKQRAEAAEARASNLNDGWLNAITERDEARSKLAELEKQESSCNHHWIRSEGRTASGWLCSKCGDYDGPAPAADLAELVPDEMTWNQAHSLLGINQCGEDRFSAFMMGANYNRDAILRKIEEAKK